MNGLVIAGRKDTVTTSRVVRLALVVALALTATVAGRAQEPNGVRAFSFRVGVPASHLPAHFEQYEVSEPVLRLWSAPSGRMGLRIYATAAAVTGGRDVAYLASLGPTLGVRLLGGRVTADGGSSVAFLSNHWLGGRDFGGPIEFVSHAGFDVRLSHGLAVGYRIQHMSNAGLYDRNPGLNMHLFQITARPLFRASP